MKNHYEAFKFFERRLDGKLYSAGDMPEWLKLEYSETKFNFPKIKRSQLLVFVDESKAYLDMTLFSSKQLELWKVQCFNKPKLITKLFRIWNWNHYEMFSNKNNIIQFWQNKLPSYIDDECVISDTVKGCHQTLGVKLIEKLTL